MLEKVLQIFFFSIVLASAASLAGEGTPAEALRVAPALRARLRAAAGGLEEIDLVARLRADVPAGALGTALAEAGATGVRLLPEIRRLSACVPTAGVQALERSGLVEWIEERGQELDRDENDGVRSAVGYLGLSPLSSLLRGRGVMVGAWELGHPDTETRSGDWHGHDDFSGRVQVMETSQPTAHATQVAGLLAGDGRLSRIRGGQQLQWQGVAPDVRFLSYSTADSDEEAAEVYNAVRTHGIHLSIHSWGESVNRERCEVLGDYNIRTAEFDQAIAGEDPARAGEGGVPVVFSAGNYQNFLDCQIVGGGVAALFPGFRTINPPHTAKNVITVGAVYSDSLGTTPFSSWGPTDDGRLKPDLVAPGSERGGDGGITSPTYRPPDTYGLDEGTSYAAATVAGALGILIGVRAERGEPPLLPAAWKALLIESALDLTADPIGPTDPLLHQVFRGPDYFHGFGLLWLPDALRLSLNPGCLVKGSVESGADERFLIRYPPGIQAFRATLVWDDPAGDPAAPRALVNDLDLRIIEDFGGGIVRAHFPWVLDPERPDLPARRGTDRVNNVEQVEIDGPVLGRLSLVVVGARVPRGPQQFWIAAGAGCSLSPQTSWPFRRGDVSREGSLDITDFILLVQYLFQRGNLSCLDAADADDDGQVNITDSIRILIFLFLGGYSPAWPPLGGDCGLDTTPDRLGCERAPLCI